MEQGYVRASVLSLKAAASCMHEKYAERRSLNATNHGLKFRHIQTLASNE